MDTTEDAEMLEARALAPLLDVPEDAQATTDELLKYLLEDDDERGLLSAQAPVLTTVSHQPEKSKRPPGYNSNKARDARKHELVHLRSTVAQLENVVTQLRREHKKRGKSTRSQDLMVRRSVWRPIAARQLEERRRAEETNTQLRIQLADQTKLTESLQRMVTRPSVTQGFARCGILAPRRGYVPPTYQYDPSMRKEILREVEANYNEVDALFRRLTLNEEEEPSSGNLQVRRNDKAGRFESYQLEILPVSAHVAADIVWQHYAEHMSRVPFRQYYERTAAADDVTEDTIIERIGVELQSSETITTTSLQVMRRYTEENRVVIVWYCIMRPVMCASQNVATVDFLERGYMVFETPKALDPASHSILKMCVTLCRSHDGFRDDDELQRKVDECMFMDGIAMASTLHRSIENMLLERCRSHSFYQQTEPQIPSGP